MKISPEHLEILNPDFYPLSHFHKDEKQDAAIEKAGTKTGSKILIEKEKGLLEYTYVKKTITIPLSGAAPFDPTEISADYGNVYAEYNNLLLLSQHQNSVKPISFEYERFENQSKHQFVIKMEYGGININDRAEQMKNEKKFTKLDEKIIRWAMQSISILAYAEELQIKHGDIKLANMTTDQNDNLHLIDLGSARVHLKSISTRSLNTITHTIKVQDGQSESQDSSNQNIEFTPAYVAPEIKNKTDFDHPYYSDAYSWAIAFYILIQGTRYIKPIQGSMFGEAPQALDTLKNSANEHNAILFAVDKCSFFGENKDELNKKFIPILKACLSFEPTHRMNFLKLNTIMKKFDALSYDNIIQYIVNFTNPNNQLSSEKTVENYLTLDKINIELTKILKELLNSSNISKKGWEATLQAFSTIKGLEKVNENNVKQFISLLHENNITKEKGIENLQQQLIKENEVNKDCIKHIKAIFDLWKSMISIESIPKMVETLKQNKSTFIDPIIHQFGLEDFEIQDLMEIKKEEINPAEQNVKLPEMIDLPRKDGLVILPCSNVHIYKSQFIKKFAETNSKLESPFFHKSRTQYICPFCSMIHNSSQLKTILKGDLALLETETMKKLSQTPNLRLGKCCECSLEMDQKNEIYISECGHFYHLKCMLKKYALSLNEDLKCSANGCTCNINKFNIQRSYEEDMFKLHAYDCFSCSFPIDTKEDFGMMKCLHTYHLECIVKNKIKDCHVCLRKELEKRYKENNFKPLTEDEENNYKNLKTYEEALKKKGCNKCYYTEPKYVTLECGHSICPRCVCNPKYYDPQYGEVDFILYIDDKSQSVSCICEACDPTRKNKYKMTNFNLTCGCKCDNYFDMRAKVKQSLIYENYNKLPFTYPKCPTGTHNLNEPEMFFFVGPSDFNDFYEGCYMFLNSCRDYTSRDYSKMNCTCGKIGEVPLFNCSCLYNNKCIDCIREDKIGREYYQDKCPKCEKGVLSNKFIKICFALSLNKLYRGEKEKLKFIENFIIDRTQCCNRKGIKSQENLNQFYCFNCEYTISYENATKNYYYF